jgi:hypothetical protein
MANIEDVGLKFPADRAKRTVVKRIYPCFPTEKIKHDLVFVGYPAISLFLVF